MKGPILLFLLLWGFWILLSGGLYVSEIVVGGIVSAVISALFGYFLLEKATTDYIKGFIIFIAYVPYYLAHEILDVLDVSYRIVTGKIRPQIIEVPHSHMHEWGVTVLSNSITMMPGTLTLEAGPRKLYVHWLNAERDRNRAITRFQRVLNKIWD